MRISKCALGVAAILFTLGCSDSKTAPRNSAAGSWQGIVAVSASTNADLTFLLAENAGVVSGNGTLRTAATANALTIAGTFADPNISLSISAVGFQPMNFTGIVNGKSMTGTLNGSGFISTAVTLTKP